MRLSLAVSSGLAASLQFRKSGVPHVRTQPPTRDSATSYPQRKDCSITQALDRRQNRPRPQPHHRQTAQARHHVPRPAAAEVAPASPANKMRPTEEDERVWVAHPCRVLCERVGTLTFPHYANF